MTDELNIMCLHVYYWDFLLTTKMHGSLKFWKLELYFRSDELCLTQKEKEEKKREMNNNNGQINCHYFSAIWP